jgi:hypothetical protein
MAGTARWRTSCRGGTDARRADRSHRKAHSTQTRRGTFSGKASAEVFFLGIAIGLALLFSVGVLGSGNVELRAPGLLGESRVPHLRLAR